jgi:hypothetical protein
MNIGNFEYDPNPQLKIRKFHIQTLTDEGFSQYTNKESYTHKYLKSLSPKRVKEIFYHNSMKNKGKDSDRNLYLIKEINEDPQDRHDYSSEPKNE